MVVERTKCGGIMNTLINLNLEIIAKFSEDKKIKCSQHLVSKAPSNTINKTIQKSSHKMDGPLSCFG